MRNLTFDVMKFVFIITIAIYHLIGIDIGLGAIVMVDIMFALSGYFLRRKYICTPVNERNGVKYTLNHVKKLAPYYLFSLAILFICINRNDLLMLFSSKNAFIHILDNLYKLIPEMLFVQNIGIYSGGINYPLWQLSTLVIASYFLYTFMENNEKLTIKVICPSLIIIIFTYLSYLDSNNISHWGTIGHVLYVPLLRAFATISIGIIIYEPIQSALPKISKFVPLFDLLTLTIFMLLFHYKNQMYIYILFIPIIFLTFESEDSFFYKFFNKKCFKLYGKLSLSIYLNQAIIIPIFKTIGGDISSQMLYLSLYIIISVVFSLLTYTSVNKITNIVNSKRQIKSGLTTK